jgi:hypothetical protein
MLDDQDYNFIGAKRSRVFKTPDIKMVNSQFGGDAQS